LREEEEFFREGFLETTTDFGEGGDSSVVHPHETTEGEGVAVLFGKSSGG